MESISFAQLIPLLNNFLILVLGLFFSLIVWLAKKVDARLEDINKSIKETNTTLLAIDKELRNDLGALDRRLTRVESEQGFLDRHRHEKEENS